MSRSPAQKAEAAAEAVLAWLQSQTKGWPPAREGLGIIGAAVQETAPPVPAAMRPPSRAPVTSPREPQDTLSMGLAQPDWLHHRLTVSGPAAALTTFRAAAAGAGTIPWHLDLERLEEDWFHLLIAPPPPQRRDLSVAGARVLAGQLREAVARRHDMAIAQVGQISGCPFDLHALVPVPDDILRLGPADPAALGWLWEHWGTTQALRHVAALAGGSVTRRDKARGDEESVQVTFWSADWSPWRALTQIAAGWPDLRFAMRPSYDAA